MTLPWAVEPDERRSPVAHSKVTEDVPAEVAELAEDSEELAELDPLDDDELDELLLAGELLLLAGELLLEDEVVLVAALLSEPQAATVRVVATNIPSRESLRVIFTQILRMAE